MSIAIVALTHNRVELLKRCVENVLARTSSETEEIVIWNNASTDGTREFLDSLSDPRIRVVHHPRNVGLNGYADAFAMTKAEFLVELDDDVVEAPENWDLTLLDAYRRLPEIGFLAADLAENPSDRASYDRYNTHRYRAYEVDGLHLLEGPTGGWCSITSRDLYDRVGGMPQNLQKTYYHEEAEYIRRIGQLGFRRAILDDLHIVHAGGSLADTPESDKKALITKELRQQARRDAVKRALLALPFARRLNQRFAWFEDPDERELTTRTPA